MTYNRIDTPNIVLNKGELVAITGKVRFSSQAKVLRAFGIEHKYRPDGSPVVARTHFEQTFCGKQPNPFTENKKTQPNWEAL